MDLDCPCPHPMALFMRWQNQNSEEAHDFPKVTKPTPESQPLDSFSEFFPLSVAINAGDKALPSVAFEKGGMVKRPRELGIWKKKEMSQVAREKKARSSSPHFTRGEGSADGSHSSSLHSLHQRKKKVV